MTFNHNVEALRLIEDNDWDSAHRLIQDYSDPLACRIHGNLHRVEGDLANADYWYKRAGMTLPNNPIADELADLTKIIKSQH
jgi:hypothetical protein